MRLARTRRTAAETVRPRRRAHAATGFASPVAGRPAMGAALESAPTCKGRCADQGLTDAGGSPPLEPQRQERGSRGRSGGASTSSSWRSTSISSQSRWTAAWPRATTNRPPIARVRREAPRSRLRAPQERKPTDLRSMTTSAACAVQRSSSVARHARRRGRAPPRGPGVRSPPRVSGAARRAGRPGESPCILLPVALSETWEVRKRRRPHVEPALPRMPS